MKAPPPNDGLQQTWPSRALASLLPVYFTFALRVGAHRVDLLLLFAGLALIVRGRDLLRKYVPHLEYLTLERCGHEPWREQYAREAFAAALCAWLEPRC